MLCDYWVLRAVVHALCVASGQSSGGAGDLCQSAQLIQRHSEWPLWVVN